MDLIRIIYRLRPDVTWKNNMINAYSKDTLMETYQSSQPFPTNAEGLAAWAEIQAEDNATDLESSSVNVAVEASGFKSISLADAYQWLDDQYDPLSIPADVKSALVAIDKKFISVILKIAREL